MGKVIQFFADKLSNLVSNLGTDRDKASHSQYSVIPLTPQELTAAYRSSWMARKIIDIPPLDATREWRNWQADAKQIELIEEEEKRLGVRRKVMAAMVRARLYGGGALFIGTGERDTSQPLRPEAIKKGGIQFLVPLSKRVLTAGEIESDPLVEGFGLPRDYTINSGQRTALTVHPSRLVVFTGNPHPDADEVGGLERGWGDSVLQSILETLKQADSASANISSLLFEAKVDVIRIPGFMDGLADPEYENRVLNRLRLAMMAKGINGTLILDKEEEYDQKESSFAGLTDVMMSFVQLVAGASDIPVTRLLGQAPAGLNATGESDMRNYYDRIAAMQELSLGPSMHILDECLLHSAIGSRPDDIHYNWASLWQTSETERADVGNKTANTLKTLKDTGLFPDGALSQAGVAMLVETGTVPGLEAAMKDFEGELPLEAEDDPEQVAAAMGRAGAATEEDPEAAPPKKPVADAAPRTLYVHRPVVNAEELREWAREQGFTSVLGDLHVTIAYSKERVDWMKVGEGMSDKDGTITIQPGGPRIVEQLGGATVLMFNSWMLGYRHGEIRNAGASWDYEDYQPHVSITYEPGDVDLRNVQPYRGKIVLGPEVFEELDDNWRMDIEEQKL
jgi:phage-related protein (TIGR01555 family)